MKDTEYIFFHFFKFITSISNLVGQVVSLLRSLDNIWMHGGKVLADWIIESFIFIIFFGCLWIIGNELVLSALTYGHLLWLIDHVTIFACVLLQNSLAFLGFLLMLLFNNSLSNARDRILQIIGPGLWHLRQRLRQDVMLLLLWFLRYLWLHLLNNIDLLGCLWSFVHILFNDGWLLWLLNWGTDYWHGDWCN